MNKETTTTNFIPVTHVELGKFNTSTGRIIDLLNPSEDQIDIDDIATALSRICRFGGHSNVTYTVAQHSVLVMHLVSKVFPSINLEALLHDASEAYLGDVISPLKHIIGNSYRTLEHSFETVIGQKYGATITTSIKEQIKIADIAALEMEHEALILGNPAKLLAALECFDLIIGEKWAWPEKAAKTLFLTYFNYEYTLRNGHPYKG